VQQLVQGGAQQSGKTDLYGSNPGFKHIDTIGTSGYGIFGTAEKRSESRLFGNCKYADKGGSIIDDVSNLLGKLFKK